MNQWGASRTPFLFVVDYEMKNIHLFKLSNALKCGILFSIGDSESNVIDKNNSTKIILKKNPIDFQTYKKAFDKALENLKYGNSYLLNLTQPTPIELNISLADLFQRADASYKLLFKNEFLVFSPETFVKINNNTIFSFPMKGTIDAALPDAENVILKDEKELAEHYTIVDLIRNDLSMVSENVRVPRFRYIEKICTNEKELLQVSSEICGDLKADWNKSIGNILFSLLPAGSISGAPKKKTLEIINEIEQYQRGYYTGVFGVFDGESLDSAVMIRFIQNENGKLIYKSGGGITVNSTAEAEYCEMIDKVYVPVV